MDVKDIAAMALALSVAGIVVSFSLLVTAELQEETCPTNTTWVTGFTNSPTANTVTGNFDGCCNVINSTGGSTLNCTTWGYGAAFNATQDTTDGVGEFSDWFTIIALAIVFAIVIGIIVKYIGGAGRY